MLNRRKGPAVWGLRAQIDRALYKQHIQTELFRDTPNLAVLEAPVEDLIITNDPPTCRGAILPDGARIDSKTVVITAGTFLKAHINIGLDVRPAGRMGDAPAIGLANTLDRLGLRMGRLKTGTPPRLRKRSIDYAACELHRPDATPIPFSFVNDRVWMHVSRHAHRGDRFHELPFCSRTSSCRATSR